MSVAGIEYKNLRGCTGLRVDFQSETQCLLIQTIQHTDHPAEKGGSISIHATAVINQSRASEYGFTSLESSVDFYLE
jgi:hypothetical protein